MTYYTSPHDETVPMLLELPGDQLSGRAAAVRRPF